MEEGHVHFMSVSDDCLGGEDTAAAPVDDPQHAAVPNEAPALDSLLNRSILPDQTEVGAEAATIFPTEEVKAVLGEKPAPLSSRLDDTLVPEPAKKKPLDEVDPEAEEQMLATLNTQFNSFNKKITKGLKSVFAPYSKRKHTKDGHDIANYMLRKMRKNARAILRSNLNAKEKALALQTMTKTYTEGLFAEDVDFKALLAKRFNFSRSLKSRMPFAEDFKRMCADSLNSFSGAIGETIENREVSELAAVGDAVLRDRMRFRNGILELAFRNQIKEDHDIELTDLENFGTKAWYDTEIVQKDKKAKPHEFQEYLSRPEMAKHSLSRLIMHVRKVKQFTGKPKNILAGASSDRTRLNTLERREREHARQLNAAWRETGKLSRSALALDLMHGAEIGVDIAQLTELVEAYLFDSDSEEAYAELAAFCEANPALEPLWNPEPVKLREIGEPSSTLSLLPVKTPEPIRARTFALPMAMAAAMAATLSPEAIMAVAGLVPASVEVSSDAGSAKIARKDATMTDVASVGWVNVSRISLDVGHSFPGLWDTSLEDTGFEDGTGLVLTQGLSKEKQPKAKRKKKVSPHTEVGRLMRRIKLEVTSNSTREMVESLSPMAREVLYRMSTLPNGEANEKIPASVRVCIRQIMEGNDPEAEAIMAIDDLRSNSEVTLDSFANRWMDMSYTGRELLWARIFEPDGSVKASVKIPDFAIEFLRRRAEAEPTFIKITRLRIIAGIGNPAAFLAAWNRTDPVSRLMYVTALSDEDRERYDPAISKLIRNLSDPRGNKGMEGPVSREDRLTKLRDNTLEHGDEWLPLIVGVSEEVRAECGFEPAPPHFVAMIFAQESAYGTQMQGNEEDGPAQAISSTWEFLKQQYRCLDNISSRSGKRAAIRFVLTHLEDERIQFERAGYDVDYTTEEGRAWGYAGYQAGPYGVISAVAEDPNYATHRHPTAWAVAMASMHYEKGTLAEMTSGDEDLTDNPNFL